MNESAFNRFVDVLTSLHALILFLAFIIGSLIALISWVIVFSRDAKLEREFKKVVNKTTKNEWIKGYKDQAPKNIIVTSEEKKSAIRYFFKGIYLKKIRRKKITERNIVVIKNEEDRITGILEMSYSYIIGQELLDLDFIAGLKHYFCYKYVNNYSPDF